MSSLDIVMIGDFRFPGGTSVATAHEIRALADGGLSIGLVQSNARILKQDRPVHPQIQACIRRGEAKLLPASERSVSGRLGIFHNPMAFTGPPKALPGITVDRSIMVAHQPPTDRNGVPYYNPLDVDEICRAVTGVQTEWAPISSAVRDNLRTSAPAVALTSADWHNTIYPKEWASKRINPVGNLPVIGRHSRPDREKWPSTKADILEVYPDDPSVHVRFLGAGDHLKRVMGEYPANWTTHRFGQMDPADFLKLIDFFVYYHHPDWFEAFGRTVMEACASGAVAILPPHFESTFGDAAIYRAPSEAVATAREFYADWRSYRAQSERARKFIEAHHSPIRHLNFINGLMNGGTRRIASRRSVKATSSRLQKVASTMKTASNQYLSATQYDVVILADMRSSGDVTLRISHEIRIQHAQGFRTALLHVPSGRIKSSAIRGEIHACVRAGMADVLTPSHSVSTKLLVIHGPEDVLEPIPDKLARISAEKIVVVCSRPLDRSYSPLRKHRLLSLAFQNQPIWAPATPQIREALLKAWPEAPLEAENWSLSLATRPWKDKVITWDRAVVGRLETEPPLDFGKTDKPDDKPSLPSFNGCYVRVLQAAPVQGDPPTSLTDVLAIDEQAIGKFLDSLDVLFVDEDDRKPIAHCAIAEAMQRGVIVLCKGETARELGPGALGCGGAKAEETIKILVRNRAELRQLACEASRNASARFAPSIHAERISRLTGVTAKPPIIRRSEKQRIAFITSNGVGLGHLTRLLCIARRLPPEVAPIFVTMSQAYGIVKDFGFPVEYLPFSSQSEMSSVQDWNDWFKIHIEQIFDAYGITGAVFDGGAPYGGLVRALASRPDMFSVWVRRGMWRPGKANDNLLKRQKYFDLIIEPRDVADVRDKGPTTAQQGRAAHVDPIRLLDHHELLDRRAAAKELGIDPNRPAVLIQLGSGTTSEIVSQTNDVIAACSRFPRLQIVIAEWAIGAVSFDVWPNVKVLRGFPLSRFFKAFDFTISAVGYNSFNEIMSFGLPAVFIANENPIMDDQAARAAFAVEQGAAFMTSPQEIKDLHAIIAALMDSKARSVIWVNTQRIAMQNGAQAAADLICKMAGVSPQPATEQPPPRIQVVSRAKAPVAKKSTKVTKRVKEKA